MRRNPLWNGKRNNTRHRKRIQLRYGLDSAKRIGFTEDVSDEGFFIKTGMVEQPGSRMHVELTMPDGASVRLEGFVSWAKKVPANLIHRIKGGMGIRITHFKSGEAEYRAFCDGLHARY
jgi:PilZ domain